MKEVGDAEKQMEQRAGSWVVILENMNTKLRV
jgi:hypothetical protein